MWIKFEHSKIRLLFFLARINSNAVLSSCLFQCMLIASPKWTCTNRAPKWTCTSSRWVWDFELVISRVYLYLWPRLGMLSAYWWMHYYSIGGCILVYLWPRWPILSFNIIYSNLSIITHIKSVQLVNYQFGVSRIDLNKKWIKTWQTSH